MQLAVATSLERGIVGFLIAIIVGTPIGLLLAEVRVLRRAIGPIISGLQVLPSVAWVPAAIIWFGLTDATVYFVILMGAIPSIVNGLIAGVDQVPPQLRRVGQVLGASRWQLATAVILPAALPGYLAGLKQGWAFSWRSLMAAEIIATGGSIGFGLGSMLQQSRELADLAGVLATILADPVHRHPDRTALLRPARATRCCAAEVCCCRRFPMTGRVTLVGAGPGDPGLLTVKGLRALERADVIVADRLGARGVLDGLAAEGVELTAEVVDVGKLPGHHAVPQDGINALLVHLAREGKHVVRLKGGDPYVFGRGGEELEFCREAGVDVEVVPGITSAISVPAIAGIPLTHRGLATAFTVVTGHDQIAALSGGRDHTVVLLMGVGTLAHSAITLAGGAARRRLPRRRSSRTASVRASA